MSFESRSLHVGRSGPGSVRRLVPRLLSTILLGFCLAGSVAAGTVEIADAPIPTGGSIQVKPNIMFVLDDSGSMESTYIPDVAALFAFKDNGADRYGFASPACNGMYYNNDIDYAPPVKADGTRYPEHPFTAAPTDGFNLASPVRDLSSQFRAADWGCDSAVGGVCDSPQAAYYYQYTRPKNGAYPLTYVYSEDGGVYVDQGMFPACNSVVGKTPGRNVFTKVTSADSGFRKQNFANWYSYYRSRINAMKSATGRAFDQILNPDGLRMGFSTLSENQDYSKYQPLDDFCAADCSESDPKQQRSEIFSKLYASAAKLGSTPLRSSMAKFGRMYAGFDKGSRLTGSADPVLYSCQQNFLILATDGAWNGDANAAFNIANSGGVGDRDGDAPKPMQDAFKVSNTLADIAMYYYETDLRDPSLNNCTGGLGEDVCTNDAQGGGRSNKASTQHMTTFTLGFGIDGLLKYAENYDSGLELDYSAILSGTKKWPNPSTNTMARVDDLWHAAVNGRGKYFSAKTPDSLVNGLVSAIKLVESRPGAGSGAATSSLEPTAGDDFAYVASYRTVHWDGDLQARRINLITGAVAAETDRSWSARAKLDEQVAGTGWSTRKIYMKGSGTTRLDFTPTNVRSVHSSLPDELTNDVIDFIRGDSSKEDQAGNTTRTLRDRTHVLGDIVSSHPVYVRRPPYKYSDSGYADFASDKATRAGIVLVGANDGMLHAFDADSGSERWAYVPAAVIRQLHWLAHKEYGQSLTVPHQYYVDGAITVGDICVASDCADAKTGDWRTIAVVGLGKGGRAYFALDITDTADPKILWEFADDDLGFSFGNPIITKRAGRWVVLFGSGYNNVSSGDGKGQLFVLDAKTGAKLSAIEADTGTDAALSGIAKISNWVDNLRLDDTTRYVYAGDLSGRLWRFDLTSESATLLASFGSDQPITTRPELAEVKAGDDSLKRVVFVGTGKYLGLGDLNDASLQSIYAVRDELGTTGWGAFRTSGSVEQVMTADGNKRTITQESVDWTTGPGWFVDLDAEEGERVNVDFKIVSGVLTVVGNVPELSSCTVGGRSYIYFFDYRTGSSVQTVENAKVGEFLTNAPGVGLSVIRLSGKEVAIVNTADNRQISVPVPPASASGDFRRVMWRELVTEHSQ